MKTQILIMVFVSLNMGPEGIEDVKRYFPQVSQLDLQNCLLNVHTIVLTKVVNFFKPSVFRFSDILWKTSNFRFYHIKKVLIIWKRAIVGGSRKQVMFCLWALAIRHVKVRLSFGMSSSFWVIPCRKSFSENYIFKALLFQQMHVLA